MAPDLHTLAVQVQHNCHISDARHARNYSLCIYLLKMREYFRWEMGFGYGDRLPEKQLGEWLVAREQLWATLEEADYAPIAVDSREFAPFESAAVNDVLLPERIVYSGGYGGLAKPHFFLAELHAVEQRHGRRIMVTGRELARDLTAPPAMTQAGDIYVRRESLRRMLWERIEEWRWRPQENAMARALRGFDLERHLAQSLDTMTDAETDAAIMHELGEIEAGMLVGPEWEQMLEAVWHTRAELAARAVRDHLADAITTLPTLLAEQRDASLHFYFANMGGMRLELYPALVQAYRRWQDGEGLLPLRETVARDRDHWLGAAKRMLQVFREDEAPAERVAALIDVIRL